MSRYGARVFEAGRLDDLVKLPESPPSYDELGPTPPPTGPHDDEPPLKRARKESGGDQPTHAGQHSEAVPRSKDELTQTREYLLRETHLQTALEERNSGILRRVVELSQQVSRLEADAKERNDRSGEDETARYERLKEEVTKNHDVKENLTEQLENLRDETNERLDRLETNTSDLIEEAKDEVSNLVDVRID
ncbi:hypothetical protein SLS56_011446, partial [Neofusicoccum ribis]